MNESPREEAAGVDSTQTLRPVICPPTAVIVMSLLWGSAACLEFLIWLFERQTFYLVVAFIAAVFTVLILKGVCASYAQITQGLIRVVPSRSCRVFTVAPGLAVRIQT